MTKQKNTKTQKIILGVLLVGFALILVKQYMPKIELPTDSHIQEEQNRLKSLIGDLAFVKKNAQDWQKNVAELRGKSNLFWVRTKMTLPVEQEVLDEFNSVLRLAGVNVQNKEARLNKTNNVNYIQEVELRVDMRGSSMREVTRLLQELDSSRRRFTWSNLKIEPDNLQKPTGVKLNGRLRAYVLNDDAVKILGGDVDLNTLPTNTGGKSKNGKGTVKGKANARNGGNGR